MLNSTKDVKYIKGVGPNRATMLNKLGIYTLEDLITHFPREHEDRGNPTSVIDVQDGRGSIDRSNSGFKNDRKIYTKKHEDIYISC